MVRVTSVVTTVSPLSTSVAWRAEALTEYVSPAQTSCACADRTFAVVDVAARLERSRWYSTAYIRDSAPTYVLYTMFRSAPTRTQLVRSYV